MDVIVDRCAGLDVHKKTVMATIRTPDGAGGRAQQTREFATFTGRLVELREWLAGEGVTQVARWRPRSGVNGSGRRLLDDAMQRL